MKGKMTFGQVPRYGDTARRIYLSDSVCIGTIHEDYVEEIVGLWNEAHSEETIAQRVARRIATIRGERREDLIKISFLTGRPGQFSLQHEQKEAHTVEEIESALQHCVLSDLGGIADALGLTLAELFAEEEPNYG